MKVFSLRMYYTHIECQNWLDDDFFGKNVFLSLDDAQRYAAKKAEKVLEPFSCYGEVIDFTAVIFNAEITSEGIVSIKEIFRKKYDWNDFNYGEYEL
jgi:hypothetical protein